MILTVQFCDGETDQYVPESLHVGFWTGEAVH